jgi:hypothetical protein
MSAEAIFRVPFLAAAWIGELANRARTVTPAIMSPRELLFLMTVPPLNSRVIVMAQSKKHVLPESLAVF